MTRRTTTSTARRVRRLFTSTSRRVLVLFPAMVAIEQARARRALHPAGLALVLWGWQQYEQAGRYRTRLGGGGPGLSNPPDRLVTSGIYAHTRNPMYLGHMIALAGLAVTTRSPLAVALFVGHVPWFDRRAARDEEHLAALFGPAFEAYRARVPRWLPRPATSTIPETA